MDWVKAYDNWKFIFVWSHLVFLEKFGHSFRSFLTSILWIKKWFFSVVATTASKPSNSAFYWSLHEFLLTVTCHQVLLCSFLKRYHCTTYSALNFQNFWTSGRCFANFWKIPLCNFSTKIPLCPNQYNICLLPKNTCSLCVNDSKLLVSSVMSCPKHIIFCNIVLEILISSTFPCFHCFLIFWCFPRF